MKEITEQCQKSRLRHLQPFNKRSNKEEKKNDRQRCHASLLRIRRSKTAVHLIRFYRSMFSVFGLGCRLKHRARQEFGQSAVALRRYSK